MIQLINMPDYIDENQVKLWLVSCAITHDSEIKRLVCSFISKEHMLSLNSRYLNHNTDTDIITFPYGTNEGIIAELFISIEQALENAKKYNQSAENEIIRLISHGLLHCLGFHDKTPVQKEKMTKEEDKMIKTFHVKH